MGLSVELVLLNPSTRALSGFGNLEPLSVGGVELVASNRAARSQVHLHGTGVVWPVIAVVGRPEYIDIATRVGRSDKGGRLRVGPTGHRYVVSTLDGAGVGDLTDGGVWERLSAGDGALVGLAINGDLAGNTVGLGDREKHEGDKEREGGEEESGSLHGS